MTTMQRHPTDTIPAGLDTAELLRLYEQMVLIRSFELAVQEVYKKAR